jgi:hypothetical protein
MAIWDVHIPLSERPGDQLATEIVYNRVKNAQRSSGIHQTGDAYSINGRLIDRNVSRMHAGIIVTESAGKGSAVILAAHSVR